ncbi:hypothetical protein F5878DRAFT_662034 [Lentinula raphanica]|uniref:Uncharacterized protein n=1 Tax=Lentinula raphanica TaxID=153919 RepID=A0AA38UDE5_9AGAR|nr:hypothetical protein F5878DRAFT_662034 [Lentinula raphanica]
MGAYWFSPLTSTLELLTSTSAKLDTPEAYNPASRGSTNATALNSEMQDNPTKNPAKKVHPNLGGQLQTTIPTREDKLQYIESSKHCDHPLMLSQTMKEAEKAAVSDGLR